jgi:hypothetical protein
MSYSANSRPSTRSSTGPRSTAPPTSSPRSAPSPGRGDPENPDLGDDLGPEPVFPQDDLGSPSGSGFSPGYQEGRDAMAGWPEADREDGVGLLRQALVSMLEENQGERPIRTILAIMRDSGADPQEQYQQAVDSLQGRIEAPPWESVNPDATASGDGAGSTGLGDGTASTSALDLAPPPPSTSPVPAGLEPSPEGLASDLGRPGGAPLPPDLGSSPEGAAPPPARPDPREALRAAVAAGNRGRRPPGRAAPPP